MRSLHPGLLLLALLQGCPVGTTASGYQPARGAAGASIDLELTHGRKVHGELLAVESAGLLVLQSRRLVRVPMASLEQTRAPKVSQSGHDLSTDVRNRLRLISRYPQGVSGELEARLLQAYGQDAVDVES